jgi:hypothetical protein
MTSRSLPEKIKPTLRCASGSFDIVQAGLDVAHARNDGNSRAWKKFLITRYGTEGIRQEKNKLQDQ